MSSPYQKAYFVLSVAEVKQLPPDEGREVAIVGRSNSGKSSVLNKLTVKGLARVSKTPGRTQLLNVFNLDDKRRLIDLPGYGYAKVSPQIKRRWQILIDRYFAERTSLRGLLLIMDIRHPFKPLDSNIINYCKNKNLKVHILLNKADKLSRQKAQATLFSVKEILANENNLVTFQLFSAHTGAGLPELKIILNKWYDFKE